MYKGAGVNIIHIYIYMYLSGTHRAKRSEEKERDGRPGRTEQAGDDGA